MESAPRVSMALGEGAPPRPTLAGRRRWVEAIAEGGLRIVALAAIAAVVLILVFVGKEALPVLTDPEVRREVTLLSMFAPSGERGFMWQPVSDTPIYNVVPLVVGTLKVTLVAIVIAAPISIMAALYVAEYASRRVREVLKPAVELLAGVPSVVVGLFVLLTLASWSQRVFGTEHRLNALVAGFGISIAVMPIIFTVSEDALRAVPASFRTAALALGSDRFQTIWHVVLRAAAPGISAAVVLGFGRAIGETMIVVLASGNAALVDASLGHSTRTLSATIAQELAEVVVGSPHYHVLFALGVLLFLTTFVLNVIGQRIIARMRRRLGGAA